MPRATGLVVLVLAAAGCGGPAGPPLHPVSGKVTVGGTPAAGALVVFHPRGSGDPNAPRPAATTADDGTFSLSIPAGAGAPAGEYDVSVVWEKPAPANAPTDGDATVDALGLRYSNPAKSGLKATVAAGENRLPPFELK